MPFSHGIEIDTRHDNTNCIHHTLISFCSFFEFMHGYVDGIPWGHLSTQGVPSHILSLILSHFLKWVAPLCVLAGRLALFFGIWHCSGRPCCLLGEVRQKNRFTPNISPSWVIREYRLRRIDFIQDWPAYTWRIESCNFVVLLTLKQEHGGLGRLTWHHQVMPS